MHLRQLRQSDIPILNKMALDSGFPYPDLTGPHIEAVMVAVDSEDNPIMACAAKRLVETYLYVNRESPAPVKNAAMKLLHIGMAEKLRAKMYNSCEAFLPEIVSARFGRRLERTFGWVKNWQSWSLRF